MSRALLWPVIGRVGWAMEVIETFADYYDAVDFVNANPAYEIGEPEYPTILDLTAEMLADPLLKARAA